MTLPWAPPTQTSPVTITVTQANQGYITSALDNAIDYIIDISEVVNYVNVGSGAGLIVIGGRTVVIIGGEINIPDTGGDTPPEHYGLMLKNQQVAAHVEGLYVHGAGLAGAIVLDQANDACVVTIQKCRLISQHVEITGTLHPDCIQAWRGPYQLKVAQVTARTTSKGFMLQPEQFESNPLGTWMFKDVEIAGPRPPEMSAIDETSYLCWKSLNPTNWPITFDNFWVSHRTSLGWMWPDEASWSPYNDGAPPAEFAPVDEVGMTYVSEGYSPMATAYDAVIDADSPVAHWKLGEASGTTMDDRIGSNDGTYQTNAVLAQPGVLQQNNGADTSLGATGLVTVGGLVTQTGLGRGATDPWSFEAWVKPNAGGSENQNLFSFNATGLGLDTGDVPFVWSNTTLMANPATALTPGAPAHIVATFDGTTRRLYINGALSNSDTPGANQVALVGNVGVGCYVGNGNSGPTGLLDEVAMYHTALSGARVLAHYQAGIAPSTYVDNLNGTGSSAIDGRLASGGYTWVKDGGGTLQLNTGGTYGRMSAGNYAVYTLGGNQPSADYRVRATYKLPGGAFGDTFALKARGASANSFYALVSNNGVWRIVLVTAATGSAGWTDLGGAYTAALANNDVVDFIVRGTTLTAVINGVQRIQVTDATLAGPGKAGVYWNAVADDTGVGFEDFSVNAVGSLIGRYVAADMVAVDTWPDSSGYGRDMVQASGAARPVKTAAQTPNGGPSVLFDGTNDSMATGVFSSPTAGTTVIAMIKPTHATDTFRTLINHAAAATWVSPFARVLMRTSSAANTGWEGYVESAASATTAAQEGAAFSTPVQEGKDTWFIIELVYDQTNVKLFRNGVETATKALTGAMTSSIQALMLGARTGPGDYYMGHIAELRYYDSALSGGARTTARAEMIAAHGAVAAGGGGAGRKDSPGLGAGGLWVPNQKETRIEVLDD